MTDELTWSEQLAQAQRERLELETQLRDALDLCSVKADHIRDLEKRLAEYERDKTKPVAEPCDDGYSGWLYSDSRFPDHAHNCDRTERTSDGELWLWFGAQAARLSFLVNYYRSRSLSGPWEPVPADTEAKGGA